MFELAAEVTCLIAVEALLLVLAWKLRRGQWLRLIAGNTLATDEETERPYQRQMGRDVANVLVLCAAGLPVLIWLAHLADAGAVVRGVVNLAVTAFVVMVVAACVILSIRARRAARAEDRALSLPEPSKADGQLDRTQAIVVCVLVATMLAISLLAVPLAS